MYVERESERSYVLLRYFKFLLERQTVFILALSVVAVSFHYQTLASARVEVKCRLLAGDRI